MKKTSLIFAFLLQSFFVFSQSKWKDFVQGFPAMPMNVEIDCSNTLNLQSLNSIDGKKYLGDNKSDVSAYYKIGKITFPNGNIGLAYATRAGERLFFQLDVFDKKGKLKDAHALGTSYSIGGGSSFKITKEGNQHKIWIKNTQGEDSLLLSEAGYLTR